MNPRIAMFPGTFDPVTLGHLDIIERSSKLFDKVYVVVAKNPKKATVFTAEERKELIERHVKQFSNVEVVIWDHLVVDLAKKYGIMVIIRGVRSSDDFDAEFEQALINKQLYNGIETFIMPTDPKNFLMRSSTVKEMASFGADISNMVPQDIAECLSKKLFMLT